MKFQFRFISFVVLALNLLCLDVGLLEVQFGLNVDIVFDSVSL